MCGRAALTASPDDLREAFGLAERPAVTPHYNVPPSQTLYVVREASAGRRTLDAARWGLLPYWAKDPKVAQRLSLARVETVTTAPAFREAILRRRCLVAVDAFYEWKREGKSARPFVVRAPGCKPFALAGLWERWVSPDGEVVETCAILTQPARPPVDAVHDRMPIVLAEKDWSAWLDPAAASREALARLLEPTAPELVAYEVSRHVNDPRNDDAACLAPAGTVQQTLFG
jgi:putative SOS response-associated peptidase YedK